MKRRKERTMKRTVSLILAMLFSLCLLLPAAASQDPPAEAASTRIYTVNGHWYTQAQYQSLFGGAGGQARPFHRTRTA